ncbi:ribose ABC transporter permease [Sporomusaceae bacterium FL31]|nr:ribose ABC transporter permease [Sporomusaceae bacterium FL31]GCE32988.1 ribose ABC transporter permease [Sporomusaceae bacterium]
MAAENKAGFAFIGKLGPLLGLVILSIVLTFLSDRFLTVDNLLNVTRQVSINAIISVGMTLVILTGGIDLSVGSILAFSGSITAGLLAGGQTLSLAVFLGLIVGAGLGFINGILITRAGIPPFIATLGTMTTARGFTLVYTDGRPITGMDEVFRFLGGGYIASIPVPVIIMAVIFIAAYIMLKQTKFGRYIYAIGGNEEAARLSGINTKRVLTSVYTLGGLLAGFSGVIMASRLNSAQPTAGIGFELDAIAAVVLGGTSLSGGVGTIAGTLIGAMIIGVLDNGLNLLNVSSFYQQVAKGVVILLAVYVDKKRKGR